MEKQEYSGETFFKCKIDGYVAVSRYKNELTISNHSAYENASIEIVLSESDSIKLIDLLKKEFNL